MGEANATGDYFDTTDDLDWACSLSRNFSMAVTMMAERVGRKR